MLSTPFKNEVEMLITPFKKACINSLIYLFLIIITPPVSAGTYTGETPLQNTYNEDEFIAACRTGNIEAIDFFIRDGRDINTPVSGKENQHLTPLMYAVHEGQDAAVLHLLKNHADHTLMTQDGMSALIAAIKNKHYGCIDHLASFGASMNRQKEWSKSPLRYAINTGDPHTVERVLYYGATQHRPLYEPLTPSYALLIKNKIKRADVFEKSNFLQISQLLKVAEEHWPEAPPIGHDSLLNEYDPIEAYQGVTPLIWHYNEHGFLAACRTGNLEAVQFYLQQPEFNPLRPRPSGSTGHLQSGLFLAARYGHHEVVGELINYGAPVNARVATDRKTPLEVAAIGGHVNTVVALIKYGADVNSYPVYGPDTRRTPLHFAAAYDNWLIIQLLLKNGAQPSLNEKDSTGKTPLFLASMRGNCRSVLELNKYGAKSNIQKGSNGATPLSIARDNKSFSTDKESKAVYRQTIVALLAGKKQTRGGKKQTRDISGIRGSVPTSHHSQLTGSMSHLSLDPLPSAPPPANPYQSISPIPAVYPIIPSSDSYTPPSIPTMPSVKHTEV